MAEIARDAVGRDRGRQRPSPPISTCSRPSASMARWTISAVGRRHRPGWPGALGVAVAAPSSRSCVSGDGSSMYSIQALWTAAHHDLPIVFVILANRGTACSSTISTPTASASMSSNKPYMHMDLSGPALGFCGHGQGHGHCRRPRVAKADDIGPGNHRGRLQVRQAAFGRDRDRREASDARGPYGPRAGCSRSRKAMNNPPPRASRTWGGSLDAIARAAPGQPGRSLPARTSFMPLPMYIFSRSSP